MPCYNCGKPAMVQHEDQAGNKFPLCLDCHAKLVQASMQRSEMLERAYNFFAQQMDNIAPWGPPTPRFPERKPPIIHTGELTLNNIKVDRSTIGVLNTGSIEMVDSAVTVLHQAGNDQLSDAIRELTQAVVSSTELASKQKNELVQLLSVVASEATQEPPQRRSAAMWPVIERVATLVGGVANLAEIWDRVSPILRAAFPS
jgi:hypothetical protein